MSAQPVEPPMLPGQVHRVPRTIKGISDRLSEEQRVQFLGEVMAAELGPELENLLSGWYAEAMFGQLPDRAERRARAVEEMRKGRKISLEEIKAGRRFGKGEG
ncbi:hypothetical protein AGRA3207_001356 [Actinomadura graeca]|uniref:Uncharacterized protein n=1 Tax=Actinomadura graeca TaxID=2750812 RepID=A0ABX8QQY4_9ACTN|nr:hypothetical protein [Actinomadura graeca]QXJ20614.1 hypothetical protein AGRA3207_001356 [Actinomadura graeca]